VKHYSIETWVDYLRGLVSDSEKSEMEEHLASDCTQCHRSLDRMRATQAEISASIEVPETFLQRARLIFPSASQPKNSPLQHLVAILTFDTFSELAPVGVRGAPSAARRLAFEIDDVKIDLLIDYSTPTSKAMLTGQITTINGTQLGQIRLKSGNRTLGEARANSFGEFEMEFQLRSSMRLVISEPSRHREIEVPLNLIGPSTFRVEKPKIKPPSGPSEDS